MGVSVRYVFDWITIAETADFRDAHPRLQALFFLCAFDLKCQLIDIEVHVTCVKRAHATSSHAANYEGKCWSIDFDVKYDDKWLPHSEVARAAMGKTKGMIERDYPYGIGTDGKWHHAFVGETPDGRHADHCHLQIRRY